MPIVLSGPSGSIAIPDLIERIRVAARDRPSRDTITDNPLTTTATTINFTDGEKISEDLLIEIELEEIYVVSKPSTNQATVERGYHKTDKAQHVQNSEVITAYRHSRNSYGRAINAALDAISFAFGKPGWDTTQTFSSSKRLIQVPAAARWVGSVSEKPSGDTDLEPMSFRFEQSMPTSLISTGKAVRLTSAYLPGSGTAYIHYEESWPNLTTLNDQLDAAYPADAIDLIELGAVAYLADDEAFTRIAFNEPHASIEQFTESGDSVRAEANRDLRRFLLRRNEVAIRERKDRLAWVKGL